MTTVKLVLRSLRHYWRTNLGVFLGASVGTAVITGALLVGDSVRFTLGELARLRLGQIHLAMATGDRFFRHRLADELGQLVNVPAAPVLSVQGIAIQPDTNVRANSVQVLGVDARFWALAPDPSAVHQLSSSATSGLDHEGASPGVILNQRLAHQLNVKIGSTLLFRLEKPSLLPRDAPLSTDQDVTLALRLTVTAIATDGQFGRFGLQSNQVSPFTAYVPLKSLQSRLAKEAQANLLLLGSGGNDAELTVERANAALREIWRLQDAQLELRQLERVLEVRSDRVFLDRSVVTSSRSLPLARTVLTYFVNALRHKKRTTPYSTVAALEQSSLLASDMDNDQIVVNRWLADDLEISVGDSVEMDFYVLGAMRALEQRTARFQVRAIIPIEGEAADLHLMPPFPGLEREHCREWEPGFPIALDAIRDKDEDYWHRYRGTPKAFITLEAGQRLWQNRFGNATAIRYPVGATSLDEQRTKLQEAINPASIGLFFVPVRSQALQASTQGQDFGQLFIGFSFFLIVAALLLMAMLFVFGVEQRSTQIGTLLALGYRHRQVRRLLLCEAYVLAMAGGMVGTMLGVLYTQLVLLGLSGVWLQAVGNSVIRSLVAPKTLVIGGVSGVVIAFVTTWVVTRRLVRQTAHDLLTSTPESASLESGRARARSASWIAACAALGAVLCVLFALNWDSPSGGAFFGAGALVLVSGLALSQIMLVRLSRANQVGMGGVVRMGLRGAARRHGRSLATVLLLGCGSFMIIAVDAFRHHIADGELGVESGTGGFALIGESSLPILHDLNDEEGREALGVTSLEMSDIHVLPFRLREGDDASCLNLNRAQQPRMLGVDPNRLTARGAFTFLKTIDGSDGSEAWRLLETEQEDGSVPAIGDQATAFWALGLNVGDVAEFTDNQGEAFKVKVVGITANTVLQGSLIISEQMFLQRFPGLSGYRMLLIDVAGGGDRNRVASVRQELSRGLRDLGLELTRTSAKLSLFNEVENTYLSIFQALGGLGIMLGSVGLGVVVLRNVLERRGELALFRALGFSHRTIKHLILTEHWLLLGLGLGCGIVAAVVAVLPVHGRPGGMISTGLGLTLVGMVVSGLLWTYMATVIALRGPMLPALRNE